MNSLLKVLIGLNILFGAAVILIGLGAFLFYSAWVPFLLALGLFVVGPLENWLNNHLHLPGIDPQLTRRLIDQGTSLVFEILLLAAIILILY